jgi:hypothetical protein
MPFDETPPVILVEPLSPVTWLLHSDLVYRGESETFTVPAGYVTDFATVPRIAAWLIPRFGAYTRAAILHDWLLTDSDVSSVDADNLFRRALRELRVPPVRRTLMWVGVRWGAAFSKRRRAGWWRTAPAVLAYSLPALLLAPVFAAVAVGLAAYGIVEFIASSLSPKDETTSGSLST